MKKRLMALILILTMVLAWYVGQAEDKLIYVLCDPESYVKVRKTPRKGSEATGWIECGDYVESDGVIKNGYIHVCGITEYGEGWIHLGYVVDDAPVIEKCYASVAASGRVMSRRYIGGKRYHWLDVCSEVTIYAMSEEWAVTNKGYIRREYLDVWYE